MTYTLTDRLAILNARGGGISHKIVVMPIDLNYEKIEKVTAQLYGLCFVAFNSFRQPSEWTGTLPTIRAAW